MNERSEMHLGDEGFHRPEKTSVEVALETGTVTSLRPLKKKAVGFVGRGDQRRPERAAPSYMVTFDDGSEAVFKPGAEEIDAWQEIEPGTYYKRERAGYLVAQYTGLDNVPPTVLRTIEGQEGSLQQWLPDTKDAWELLQEDEKKFYEQYGDSLLKIYLLDYLIWHADRSGDNIVCAAGDCHAVDNGISFAEAETGYARRFYDQPLPPEAIEALTSRIKDDTNQELLATQLRELLPEREVTACLARLRHLANLVRETNTIDRSTLLPYLPEPRA